MTFRWPHAVTGLTAATLIALAVLQPIAIAQNSRSKPAAQTKNEEKKPDPPKPKPKWQPPPYEAKLLRLSEIMGALAFLQDLCASKEGAEWRSSMQQLIASEGKNPAQKARLAGAFNADFRGYELNYRTCTDNARLVISRYLSEGGKIAQELPNRYGSR